MDVSQITIGAEVVLNSGGPNMKVTGLVAKCAWSGGEAEFPIECLKAAPAADRHPLHAGIIPIDTPATPHV